MYSGERGTMNDCNQKFIRVHRLLKTRRNRRNEPLVRKLPLEERSTRYFKLSRPYCLREASRNFGHFAKCFFAFVLGIKRQKLCIWVLMKSIRPFHGEHDFSESWIETLKMEIVKCWKHRALYDDNADVWWLYGTIICFKILIAFWWHCGKVSDKSENVRESWKIFDYWSNK